MALRPISLALLLACAPPALAQETAAPTYTQHGQTPNNSGSGAGAMNATRDSTVQVDSCRQMAQKAKSMAAPTNPARADAAEKELALAADAADHGDFHACKLHVEAAMHYKM